MFPEQKSGPFQANVFMIRQECRQWRNSGIQSPICMSGRRIQVRIDKTMIGYWNEPLIYSRHRRNAVSHCGRQPNVPMNFAHDRVEFSGRAAGNGNWSLPMGTRRGFFPERD